MLSEKSESRASSLSGRFPGGSMIAGTRQNSCGMIRVAVRWRAKQPAGGRYRCDERIRLMNSARVLSLRRKAPNMDDVMVAAPGFCTPRIVMH